MSDSCDPVDCSPPGSSVHGILQARILEWVAISFSRGSSQPRNRTWVSCISGRWFTDWTMREAYIYTIMKIHCILQKHCCCSVTQPRPILCDPMDCSMPGFRVLQYVLGFAQTHVHWVDDANPSISTSVVPFSPCLQSFPVSKSFTVDQLFASGGQSTGVSASASVLPMNTQDWSPSGWTGWISLQSKGLSRVLSNTTVQKHQFFGAQPSSWSNSHIHAWLLEKP